MSPYDGTVGKRSIERDLEVIATLREPTRRRLYEYIEQQPRAVSRDEAAEAIGVQRALAAFHLEKLVDAGLLKPEYRRLSGRSGPGAGRTSKLYRRSRRRFEVSIPRHNHELLARLLAESIQSPSAEAVDGSAAHEYGRSLGVRARKRAGARASARRLVGCVEDVIDELGFESYRSGDDIRLRNCPFDPLSRTYSPVVCSVGQALLKGVVDGVALDSQLVTREVRPDRGCGVVHFQVVR
jgi:predicted ArsR family transcriptional regulator